MSIANENTATGQVAHADALYMSGDPSSYASAYAAPTLVENDDLGGLTHPYAGDRIVSVEDNRAGVDAYPEDTQETEDLEQEVLVGAALAAGAYTIFETGGPIGNFTDSNKTSPYVDGLFLAEASKQTGTKLF